jgi:hypothetical protein
MASNQTKKELITSVHPPSLLFLLWVILSTFPAFFFSILVLPFGRLHREKEKNVQLYCLCSFWKGYNKRGPENGPPFPQELLFHDVACPNGGAGGGLSLNRSSELSSLFDKQVG